MDFRCCILCEPDKEPLLRRGAEEFSRRARQPTKVECFHLREKFLYRVREQRFDAVIVALPGAIGMESALNVRELRPTLPLVWISDDEDFAIASYRLQARVFLRFPVTKEQIIQALERCAKPK